MRMPVPALLRRCLLATVWLWVAVAPIAEADEDFLDPEVAFRLSAKALDARTVAVDFAIAPGYYLYREQFKIEASGVTLGMPVLPAGTSKFDETFQKTIETYRQAVHIVVPIQKAPARFELRVTNQGCADKGLCYPPQQRTLAVSLAGFGGDGSATVAKKIPAAGRPLEAAAAAAPAAAPDAVSTRYAADDALIDSALKSGRFFTIVVAFFAAGVLLSLTPCVLPMLPILSSIIVGEGAQVSRGRGFALAATYSLGMALIYTALGVAAGLAGEGLAAALQKPWVLASFAAVLAALALSMFGAL